MRYKRQSRRELAQSIMSLDAVESARVHLALNEESSFVVSDEPQNSASVVVRLHYGAKLNMDQVNAIVHLVLPAVTCRGVTGPAKLASSIRREIC